MPYAEPRARPRLLPESTRRRLTPGRLAPLLLAFGLAAGNVQAQADPDGEAFLRAQSLIEALAHRGLLPRARADAMIQEARARAGARLELKAEARTALRNEVKAEVRDEILATAQALLLNPAAGAPATPAVAAKPAAAPAAVNAGETKTVYAAESAASSPAGVVRVAYVPQVVRDSIRNEVKEEVVAQMRAEAWGNSTPSPVPEWTDKIKIEGDVRVRGQSDRPSTTNPSPDEFLLASLGGTTRAADLAAGTAAGLPVSNTQEDRARLRLRARLGIAAKVNDSTSVGLRLATGAANDRVSTNQTLGQNFNRYQFLLDRAFIHYEPIDGGSLTLGRMANPWFGTDLQWSDNLSFEGISAHYQRKSQGSGSIEPFGTLGWFPIRESAPPRGGRSLAGVQGGFQWQPSANNRLKFGLAQYFYSHMEGRVDPDYDKVLGAGRSYGQYEYEAGLRQKGNTLFLTNNPNEVAAGLTPDKFRWGLASRLRPLALTVAAEFSAFAPAVVLLSAEAVKNTAYSRTEIENRTGVKLSDGSGTGLTLRAVVGAVDVRNRGDWQASMSFRRVGSDAVLDAFTDGDLGGGGTNLSGYTLGFMWGLDRGSNLNVRYLSSRSLDSMTLRTAVKDKYAVDALMVDFNVRF
jgi:hypothetical protein